MLLNARIKFSTEKITEIIVRNFRGTYADLKKIAASSFQRFSICIESTQIEKTEI